MREMLPRCAMILQADSHDVSLVKSIIVVGRVGNLLCVRPSYNAYIVNRVSLAHSAVRRICAEL